MKTLFILALSFGVSLSCFSQANYSQSHKEIEYHFGIIADSDYEAISEIERIKYELRQVERTYNKTINSNFQTMFETIILHDDNEESWMNAAKRFVHTPQGIMLYDANDSLTKIVSYSLEQEADNQAISNDIASNGYHPGLTLFPTYTAEVETALINAGIPSLVLSLIYF